MIMIPFNILVHGERMFCVGKREKERCLFPKSSSFFPHTSQSLFYNITVLLFLLLFSHYSLRCYWPHFHLSIMSLPPLDSCVSISSLLSCFLLYHHHLHHHQQLFYSLSLIPLNVLLWYYYFFSFPSHSGVHFIPE